MREDLTPRQQKLLEMLLKGIQPKEIAYNLNISYNTLLSHQKQLYRKLDVHSIHELVTKYGPNAKSEAANVNAPRKKTLPVKWFVISGILLFAVVLLLILFFIRKPANEGFPAVFGRWGNTFKDNRGSSIDVAIIYDDIIDGMPFTSYTMSGVLSGGEWPFAGGALSPDSLTLQTMRRMTSFSFKVLGDGKTYTVNIPTTDTNTNDWNEDHYCYIFSTLDGQISTITVKVDDLMQTGYGKQVPFIRSNIVTMDFIRWEFFNESPVPYNLKVWDIRIF